MRLSREAETKFDDDDIAEVDLQKIFEAIN